MTILVQCLASDTTPQLVELAFRLVILAYEVIVEQISVVCSCCLIVLRDQEVNNSLDFEKLTRDLAVRLMIEESAIRVEVIAELIPVTLNKAANTAEEGV